MEEKSEQPDLRAEKRAGAMASGRECSPKQACRKETGGYARGCRGTDLILSRKSFLVLRVAKAPDGALFFVRESGSGLRALPLLPSSGFQQIRA
jgi:hypothetical protein